MSRRTQDGLDTGLLVFGFLVGVAVGGVIGLLNAPRSGKETRSQITSGVKGTGDSIRSSLDNVVASDPIADSIAEGKAAARRRRMELGLPQT